MKICVVTLYTAEIAEYGQIGAANKEAYARRHGYGFAAHTRSLDASRHPAFSKPAAIADCLTDNDWVFWTDADSLIMNPAITLQSIIAQAADKDMILTREAGASPVNTGQWLIRNTAWSRDALARIGAPHCPNSRPHWFEQGAFVDWLGQKPDRWQHLAILPPRVMNSTPARGAYADLHLRASRYRHGDFIIHFWPLARDVAKVTRAMQQYHRRSLVPEKGAFPQLRRFWGAVGLRRPAGAA
ncbi:MAG TPA: DUF273 domain-containing protein [Dongiaceae bacterium]